VEQAKPTKAPTLGAHASSVLARATNKSKRANKARYAPSPASLYRIGSHTIVAPVPLLRRSLTAVRRRCHTPLGGVFGQWPDIQSERPVGCFPAAYQPSNSRRNRVCSHPGASAVFSAA